MELVTLDIAAPTPKMIRPAADAFDKLRAAIIAGAGFDFLARCGDVMRPAGFVSKKDGVANRSWHKTGRAFDYDQESKALVIVSEPRGGKQYFRTYLKCADQSGKLGEHKTVRGYNGGSFSGYVFDFTAAAESVGFERIPAWRGWASRYNRREFWHYQFNPEGLTWNAAMQQINGVKNSAVKKAAKILGPNDRGPDVLEIQKRLIELNLLASNEADGIFGAKTRAAVLKFQSSVKGLDADGLVGPNTRKELFK